MDLFTDFMLATGPADIGGPQQICNLLTRQGTYFLKYLLAGMEGFQTVQGGSKMRGDVMIRDISTARNYKPGEKQTWPDPQVLDNWEVPWRFTVDHIAWNDQQVEFNASHELKTEIQNQRFVDMKKKLTMRTVTSLAHLMEDQCWALPVFSDMEQAAGKVPNSFALFCNELPNGLFASYRTANGGNNEVQAINKVLQPLWDNQRTSYTYTGVYAASGTHLFDAFDSILLDLDYGPLPGPQGAEMSDPMSRPYVCATQKAGVLHFKKSLRHNKDRFVYEQDPAYPNPRFDGIELVRVKSLDTAAIYPTGANAAYGSETVYSTYDNQTNNTPNNDGPRYHLMDMRYTKKAVFSNRIFKRLEKKSPSNQVTDHVIPVDNWHQNMCLDPRRNGVIYPAASIA